MSALSPAKSIKPKSWMLFPECQKIMLALNERQTEISALFVGGCVRNLLLGKTTRDLDIATIHQPDVVQKLCEAKGFKTVPTGIDHGTITVVVNNRVFEVTTLRRDVSTDGRRATVAFSDNWREDAERRDFTMNTLLADLDGNIYDPTEQGIQDLKAGKVVFVGDPEQRIQEDYLRILRFFRFHAYYGSGDPNMAALAACEKFADKISVLSQERVTQEFFKILMADNVIPTLELMNKNNVLKDALSENLNDVRDLVYKQQEFNQPHLMARLFVLLRGKNAMEGYFILSNKDKKFLQKLKDIVTKNENNLSPKELVYRYGHEIAIQYIFLEFDTENIQKSIEDIVEWTPPKFPINGDDLQKIGIKSGKNMGDLLDKTEDWWIKKDFNPKKANCLEYVESLLR